LDELLVEQKSSVPIQEPAGNKLDFTKAKEEIITKISDEISILGRSNDSHFEANKQNIGMLNDNIMKIWNVVSHIRKHQKEAVEPPKESRFNFGFFKVRKTSLVVAVLGLLVLILTLFCMKQQNDYALLMDEYYRQGIIIKEVQSEVDSLNMQIKTYKRRK
jgi:hypothetical protein